MKGLPAMKRSLLDYLACPSCDGTYTLLSVSKEENGEVLEAVLESSCCKKTVPVLRGVPRFVGSGDITADQAHTAENFGWQWQHFTQEDERYAEQFLGWITPVKAEFFKDKLVLEGGCGKGRHTRLAAHWGAKAVVAVDVSDAVDSAFAALRDAPNVHIVQADICKMPVKRVFDYAFSVGVLHHMPNPREGFLSLASKVRPGGDVSAWVYGAENNEWITNVVSPVREVLTSRLPQEVLLQVSKAPTALVYLATKLVYGPLNRRESTLPIAKHLFYNDYLASLADFGWREQHNIVFDHLVAPTAFYIAKDDFAEWWKAAKIDDVELAWHHENSWAGFGHVPETAS